MSNWRQCAIELIRWVLLQKPLPNEVESARHDPSVISELAKRRIDSLLYLACDPTAIEQQLHDRVLSIQLRLLGNAVESLKREEIIPITLKSAEFLPRYFHSRAISHSEDFDILVQKYQIPGAKRALLDGGWRQAVYDPTSCQLKDIKASNVAAVEASHYELAPFRRLEEVRLSERELEFARVWHQEWPSYPVRVSDDRCFVISELDVHFGLFQDFDPSALFDRSINGTLEGTRTLAVSDHLWITSTRYYNEVALHNKQSLRDFAFIAALMRGGDVDWDFICRVAESLENRPALFYPIYFLSCLGGNLVDQQFFQRLSPARGNRHRDWGWMLGRLFDVVEPMPHLDLQLQAN